MPDAAVPSTSSTSPPSIPQDAQASTPTRGFSIPPSPASRHASLVSPNLVRRPSSSLSGRADAGESSTPSSRGRPQMMLPPPAPMTSAPYGQPPSPGGSITSSMSGSEVGVGTGPGPQRLPKQMSPADIHAELEKEQEAAVNRLTRQLSLLRAQQASPTSHPISDDLAGGTSQSTYFPSSRSRRASSNASTALTNAATAGSTLASTALSRQSSIRSLSAARAETAGGIPLSRQSSMTGRSISGSGRNSPALGGESPYPYYTSQYYHSQPTSNPSLIPNHTGGSGSWRDRESQYATSDAGQSDRGLGMSFGSTSASVSGRYEEVLTARTELENVRRENDKLKDRIRELEKTLEQNGKK